ncbi:MAG: aminotransferase class I/II-fold pyridoxal phosphate-dependent enzyme [Paraclostridium sp.]
MINTPITNSLRSIVDEEIISFHMPGHKKGHIYEELGYKNIISDIFKLDTTEIPGTDNLHLPQDSIKESLEIARKAFKSDNTYYLVNGSTCGIEAAIMAVTNPKDKLIINRDCHQSAINACILADVDPVYINPVINKFSNLAEGVTYENAKKAIDNNLDAKAIFVTYPTYFGNTFNLEKVCEYAHSKGMIVIVDEAHGAHLGLSEILPQTAISQGADIVIQSTHKTLPAFTQASMLHVQGSLVNKNRLSTMLRITQSSSPSYILMVSLEIALDIYINNGKKLMENLIANINEFKKELINLKYIKIDEANDITKIFINTKKMGITGYEIEDILRNVYKIQVELSNYYGVLLIATIGNMKSEFEKLKKALYEIEDRYYNANELEDIKYPLNIPKKEFTPRQAFYTNTKSVKIDDSIGMICGEYIIPYPPGISLISPGEVITQEIIDYVLYCKQKGMNVNGVEDSSLETLLVLDI